MNSDTAARGNTEHGVHIAQSASDKAMSTNRLQQFEPLLPPHLTYIYKNKQKPNDFKHFL